MRPADAARRLARDRLAPSRRSRWLVVLLAAAALVVGCTDQPSPDGLGLEEGGAPDVAAPEQPTSDEAVPDGEAGADLEPTPLPAAPEPPPVPDSRAGLVSWLVPLVEAAADAAGPEGLAVLVTDEHGREVVAYRPDAALVPASTMKNVTAAAVLTTLGPDARLTTVVESTAPVSGDGVLDGDLALVGTGDPALATDTYGRWIYPARPRTPLESLADDLVDLGLTRVTGDVVGVAGPFSGDARAAGWPDRYFADLDARLIGGLTVDAGLVTLVRYPELDAALDEVLGDDAEDGTLDLGVLDLDGVDPEALVQALPALEGVGVGGAPGERRDGADADDGGAGPFDGVTVDVADLGPHELAVLLGLDGPGPPDVRVRLADDPAAHAATELVRLLEDRGVAVEGEARSGELAQPVVGRLAAVSSPTAEELLRFALKQSDNHMTDQLFHVIGRVRTGEGSWERGDRAVRQVLSHLGVDHAGARFADGSGLSRDGRLTARLLVDLDRVMTGSRHGEVWTSLMAVMGEDGTLHRRLRGTPAQGRFLGKTGTLRDVTALAGAVVGDDGGRYHLAVIANDPGEGRWIARLLMDELVLALVADLESCELRAAAGADDGPLGRPPSVVAC
jgi:serine-type D-Ala-D-Ala carboxypeptidase/endopeptidase (penicillin-binding protein 4)